MRSSQGPHCHERRLRDLSLTVKKQLQRRPVTRMPGELGSDNRNENGGGPCPLGTVQMTRFFRDFPEPAENVAARGVSAVVDRTHMPYPSLFVYRR